MNALTPSAVTSARLPQTYEAAKAALAACWRIDECKDWADKAAALAAYARQSEDKELQSFAMRIKGRALRRVGELLKEVEPAKNHHDKRTRDGAVPSSRKQAAQDAGLSERQAKTAQRLANLDGDQFEKMIERDKPATITEMADAGKNPAPPKPLVDHGGRSPQQFNAAMHFTGLIESISRDIADFEREKASISDVIDWLDDSERREIGGTIPVLRNLIEQLERATSQ